MILRMLAVCNTIAAAIATLLLLVLSGERAADAKLPEFAGVS